MARGCHTERLPWTIRIPVGNDANEVPPVLEFGTTGVTRQGPGISFGAIWVPFHPFKRVFTFVSGVA